jgi:glucosamine--fructose-6-phosphate aminotransferase (isomerizing)
MCGIVGVLGSHEVAPLLVEALKRLEYRGYDSAGIATVNNGRLDRRRAVGKLVNLSDLLVHDPLPGKSGIGHTRWATHGAVTVKNAHPHRVGQGRWCTTASSRTSASCAPNCRRGLCHAGIRDRYRNRGPADPPPHGPGRRSARRGRARTLAACTAPLPCASCSTAGRPDDLRPQGQPAGHGHGEGEMFVGSDAIALAPMTDRITYLEDGDWAASPARRRDLRPRGPPRQPPDHPHPARCHPDRKGRLQAFHGQGDRRTAGGDRRCAETLHRATDTLNCPQGWISRASTGSRWWPAAPPAMPAMSRNTGSSRSPACPPTSTSRPSSATASRCCHPPRWPSSSASRARPPTRWPRCAMSATRWRKVVSVVNVPTSSIARESDLALPIHGRGRGRRGLDQGLHLPVDRAGADGAEGRRWTAAGWMPPRWTAICRCAPCPG